MYTQYLGVLASTAEVCVEMEAPPDVDEGMYNCSQNSIIRYLISFVVFVPALHNYYMEIYTNVYMLLSLMRSYSLCCYYRPPDCAGVHQAPRVRENNQHSTADRLQLLSFWPPPPA